MEGGKSTIKPNLAYARDNPSTRPDQKSMFRYLLHKSFWTTLRGMPPVSGDALMSMPGFTRAAALAIPLTLATSWAMAQQVFTLAPGMVVVVTPSVQHGANPMRQQMERLFAAHQATLARILAGRENPPSSLMGEMMDHMSGRAPGTRPGAMACPESISITFSGATGKPVVNVSRSGDRCGAVPRMAPTPAETFPPPRPAARQNLLEVNEPAPIAVEPPVRRRT